MEKKERFLYTKSADWSNFFPADFLFEEKSLFSTDKPMRHRKNFVIKNTI